MRKPVITNMITDYLINDEIFEKDCLENKVDIKF